MDIPLQCPCHGEPFDKLMIYGLIPRRRRSVSRHHAGGPAGSNAGIIAKRRPEPNECQVIDVIGDVKDKRVVIIDDIVDTAGSLVSGAQALMERGAAEIYACASHGVLSGPAIERIQTSPIKKLIITDTIPLPPEKQIDKIEVLSMAPVLAECIRRIHNDQSLSTIFDRYWEEGNREG